DWAVVRLWLCHWRLSPSVSGGRIMAAASLLEEYRRMPSITRAYTSACVLTTAAVQLEFITPFQLYFNPDLIVKKYQVWRLLTNFLFFGPLGFSFLFNMIFFCLESLRACSSWAPFLPWVLMGFSLLLGNSVIVDLLGIAVGHIYYFLEDVFPNQPGGVRLLVTPGFLKAIFDVAEEDPNYDVLPEDQPGEFDWGQGQRLGEQNEQNPNGQQ
ncbi:hypothetical protein chiPu_0012988, partial [Chiloscyllium punctatum]|nr:hypothetical protein [Chiloscyllium punctatum]